MLLFLLCFMPCVLAFYYCYVNDKKVLPVMFIGLMTAVIYCFVRVMGFYSHRLIPDSFQSNYIYYLFRFTIIPIVAIYGIYLLITRDSWEFKTKMFFPLIGTFYAIFIPYKVIAFTQSIYNPYDIFIRPLIYMAMIAQCAISIKAIYNGSKDKNIVSIVLNALLIVVFIVLPAIFDSLYIMNIYIVFAFVGGIIYSIIPLIFTILNILKSRNSK